MLAVAAWLALAAVRGATAPPPDLMPASGRLQPFGARAMLTLREADHGAPVPFGTRPPLVTKDKDWQMALRWTGRAYQLTDPAEGGNAVPGGRLALRRLPGQGEYYVAQTLWEGEAAYSYRLAVRLPDNSFIYFHDNEECDAVPAERLRAIMPAAADRAACRVRDWRQLEQLLLAFAETGPQPFGVAEPGPAR